MLVCYLPKIPLSISQKYPSVTQKYPSLSPKNTPHYLPKIPLSDPKIPLTISQKYPSLSPKNTPQWPKNTPHYLPKIPLSIPQKYPSVTQKYLSLSPKNTPQYTRIPQNTPQYLPKIPLTISQKYLQWPKNTTHYLPKIPLTISQKYPSLSPKNTSHYLPKIPLSQGYFWIQKYPSVRGIFEKYPWGVFMSSPLGGAKNTPKGIFQKYPSLRGIFGSKNTPDWGVFWVEKYSDSVVFFWIKRSPAKDGCSSQRPTIKSMRFQFQDIWGSKTMCILTNIRIRGIFDHGSGVFGVFLTMDQGYFWPWIRGIFEHVQGYFWPWIRGMFEHVQGYFWPWIRGIFEHGSGVCMALLNCKELLLEACSNQSSNKFIPSPSTSGVSVFLSLLLPYTPISLRESAPWYLQKPHDHLHSTTSLGKKNTEKGWKKAFFGSPTGRVAGLLAPQGSPVQVVVFYVSNCLSATANLNRYTIYAIFWRKYVSKVDASPDWKEIRTAFLNAFEKKKKNKKNKTCKYLYTLDKCSELNESEFHSCLMNSVLWFESFSQPNRWLPGA